MTTSKVVKYKRVWKETLSLFLDSQYERERESGGRERERERERERARERCF